MFTQVLPTLYLGAVLAACLLPAGLGFSFIPVVARPHAFIRDTRTTVHGISRSESIRRSSSQPSGTMLCGSVELELDNFFDSVYVWLQQESLNTIIAKEEVLAVLREVREADSEANARQQFDELFDYAAEKVQQEPRSLADILGGENSAQLLQTLEELDAFDPASVRTFLQNPLFENMLGGILYEGIFEFLKRVDIVGNVVNRLPVIGPIRVAIVKEFKSSLDRTLGGQIKGFLSNGASKTAVQRMVEFVLAPSNIEGLNKAKRRVAEMLLARSPAELFSLEDAAKKQQLKEFLWAGVKGADVESIAPILDYVYERAGDKTFFRVLSMRPSEATSTSRTFGGVLARTMGRFVSSGPGQAAFQSLNNIKQEVEQQEQQGQQEQQEQEQERGEAHVEDVDVGVENQDSV